MSQSLFALGGPATSAGPVITTNHKPDGVGVVPIVTYYILGVFSAPGSSKEDVDLHLCKDVTEHVYTQRFCCAECLFQVQTDGAKWAICRIASGD